MLSRNRRAYVLIRKVVDTGSHMICMTLVPDDDETRRPEMITFAPDSVDDPELLLFVEWCLNSRGFSAVQLGYEDESAEGAGGGDTGRSDLVSVCSHG